MKINKIVYFLVILFVIRIQLFMVKKSSISLDLYSVIQMLTVACIFIFLLLQKNTSLKPIFKNKSYSLLSIIYVLGMVSILWSAIPTFSFYMAFQNLVFLAALFYLASMKGSFEELEVFLIKSSFIFILIAALGDIYRQGLSIILRWHNLETGGVSGMLVCYSLGELLSISRFSMHDPVRKKRLRRTAVISVIILILSTSSGANVSALVGLLALVLVGKNQLLRLLALLAMIFLFIFPNFLSSLLTLIFPDKSIVGITSFGYRTLLWEDFWELIKQKPFLGWGYAAIERIGEIYAIDSHNSLIGIVGGLGFGAGVLLIVYLINIITVTFRRKNEVGYLGLFSAFFCLIADSNTFGFLSSKTSLLSLAFFTLVAVGYFYAFNPYTVNEEY